MTIVVFFRMVPGFQTILACAYRFSGVEAIFLNRGLRGFVELNVCPSLSKPASRITIRGEKMTASF